MSAGLGETTAPSVVSGGLWTLLNDRQRAGKQAEAARAYVRARHDWDAVAAAYLALYQEIA